MDATFAGLRVKPLKTGRKKGRNMKDTPPKFNIDPEIWWLEDYFPIGKVTFRGYVKLRGG